MEKINTIVRHIARLFLGGLLALEILAWIGVLSIDLDFTWLGLIVTLVIAWGFVETLLFFIHRKIADEWSGWLLLFVAFPLSIDAIGDMTNLYSRFLRYDEVAHFAGGFASMAVLSYMVWAYFRIHRIRLPKKVLFLYSLGLASIAGILYESEEFFEDVLFGSNRLGDGYDTVIDLLLNLTGGVVMGFIISRLEIAEEHLEQGENPPRAKAILSGLGKQP
ncbi:MAG: hypothetical protein HYV34_03845 [Candidatus Kerfeldbacteria bacterium]|nr:hypothetical protein [Candidatus Kerfeldbacteria bacterium]